MKFKTELVKERFKFMHPVVQEIAKEMDEWAMKEFKIELTLTQTYTTKEEDKEVGRVSDTHRTGRAFDVRTVDLPEALVANLCAVFRKKYRKLGAMVSGNPNLIIYKPHGTGPHLHVQLNRKFTHTSGVING